MINCFVQKLTMNKAWSSEKKNERANISPFYVYFLNSYCPTFFKKVLRISYKNGRTKLITTVVFVFESFSNAPVDVCNFKPFENHFEEKRSEKSSFLKKKH